MLVFRKVAKSCSLKKKLLKSYRAESGKAYPSRVRSFLRPLLPSACYAGYVEVVLSSNFMIFLIISALSLGRGIHTVAAAGVQPQRLPSNLRSLDLFANHLRQTARRIPLEGGGAQG